MEYVVAVDGPAGSGKGTVTKIIEKEMGLMNLDTGITYRCVALKILENNISLDKHEEIVNIAKKLDLEILKEEGKDKVILDGKDVTSKIRAKDVTNVVSQVSSIIPVREEMVNLQRKIAKGKNVIVEGRDISTVVFPNAEVKIYIDATPEIRAKRRVDQNEAQGIECSYEEILDSIKTRDYNDMNKEVGALKRHEEAVYIDTTEMTIEEVVSKVKALIKL